ncbi:MFS transporter [Ferribacterium limneticum]|uniref:MFS transporter n=1 Tax=Ferribacterium limneticum TaxID=76259 RepID=UPI001CFB284E|nr:MFS transporter [Ferribacterium limneticum]UCV29027.1 MFS transporter [Ferribacterium limneticum]UCV32945.1 MFS transporter [Ferribacterium limneticum]
MTPSRILAYGLLGLPLAFAALPIYVHVPRFYAETAGLPLALLGFILLGARLLDAGIDPWLGWLADRVSRRRMVALALLPFGLGFVALLNPPSENVSIWLLASLALTYLGFSAATVAYQAWGADVGSDSGLRTRLTAAREGFGLLGVVLAAALPTVLAGSLNDGIARLSWILPPLLLIAAATTFIRVGVGRPVVASRQALLPSLRRVFADLAFRRLLLVFVANGIAAALPATLFLFFVADVLQLESASGPLLALYFVAGAASLPLWVKLAARQGRVVAWLLAMGLSIIAFAGASLLGAGDLWPFALICVASGLTLGADLALPAAIAADLGERQGQPGACFGVWNFVSKLNLALAAGLSLPLLALLGYVPGSTAGLPALTFAYALLPLAFKALAAALLWRWRHSLESES